MVTKMPGSPDIVTTGSTEIDKKLGGGIPIGSLVLLEGQSDSGKSVLSQHFSHGAVTSGMSVAYYTSENTVKSLITQMASLNLDITDYFLCDHFRIYPIESGVREITTQQAFSELMNHLRGLPAEFKLAIVDSLTAVVAHSDDQSILDFFAGCKRLCDQGLTIVAVVHSYAFDERVLIRVGSLCDTRLMLKVEQMGERLVKIMEVAKVRNADQSTGNVISFDVEPGLGMKIIPMSKAKA